MYDKNDEPWDLEAYLATISDPEERARTRREDGGLGYDEDGAPAYVPSFGSGPEARLNRAIGGADDDVNLDAELTVDDLVALPFPAGSEACEVEFLTGEPLEGPRLTDLIALPWPLDGHCYDVDRSGRLDQTGFPGF